MMASHEFNQPIHQVLSDYALLEVTQCEEVHFTLDQPLSWRMNLCAISQLYPTKYFIAVNNKVCVYGLTGGLVFTQQPIMALKPSTDPEFMINAIKIGAMKLSPEGTTDEILTAVGDNGEIFAWNTRTLFSSSSNINNNPFLHRYNVGVTPVPTNDHDDNDNNSDDASTWGIAMHVDGMIAVSANNHRITVYNLWAASSASQRRQNRLGERPQVELAGHVHNIPCVDFDSSGRYLASGSIDMTCRLWDLATLQQVGKRFMTRTQDSDAWLWGVKFIPKGHFKSATCDNASPMVKTLRRHVHQGRAIGTTDLHMAHSASYPIYQLDMHQMFHRLNTSDLTDEENDDNDDTDPATNHLIRLSTLLSRHLLRATDDNDENNTDEDDPTLPTVEMAPTPEVGDEATAAGHSSLLQQRLDDDRADAGLLDWEDEHHGGSEEGLWDTQQGDESVWQQQHWDDTDEPTSAGVEMIRPGDDDEALAATPSSLLQQQLDDDAADAALLEWEEHGDNGSDQDLWDSQEDDAYADGGVDWTNDRDPLTDDNDDDDDDTFSPSEGDNDNDYDDDELAGWNGRQQLADLDARIAEVDGMDDGYTTWHSDDSEGEDSMDLIPGGWDSNQREDYDDLLAEEEGWMQDRAQFPWHWLGVRSGGNDQDQGISSILQDDTTPQATEARPPSLVLYPTTTTTTATTQSTIPYVFEPTDPTPPPAPLDILTDYLMITSKKDAYLLHPTNQQQQRGSWTMATVQRERRVVSRADARTAFVLDMMERLSFVEWIPDLELCVVASQKGCVALMRILQVQLDGHHEQTCLFNHEKYLPLHGLQSSVLYGMTVHRLPAEQALHHQTTPVYQLLLLYLDGTMRSYRLSKPTHPSLVDLASVL